MKSVVKDRLEQATLKGLNLIKTQPIKRVYIT